MESVVGEILGGEFTSDSMSLVMSGGSVDVSGFMKLMLSGDPTAYVYNNMHLYTSAWNHLQVGSGVDCDPFYLAVSGYEPNYSSGTMNLRIKSDKLEENLRLRVRGK